MRLFLFTLFIFSNSVIWAQHNAKPSDSLIISGAVKQPLSFTFPDLEKYATEKINDVRITNHLGELKGTAKQLRGFSITRLLDKIVFSEANPKLLSEYYFVFVASDQYKVVYSWNELMNSDTGKQTYILTEKDGKKVSETDERILLVTPADYKTGRRYIKGLKEIMVKHI